LQVSDLSTTAPKQEEHASVAATSVLIREKTPMHTTDALRAAKKRPNDAKSVRVILIYAPMPSSDASSQQETAIQRGRTAEKITARARGTGKSSFEIQSKKSEIISLFFL